jgi:hypothetical protein
MCREPTKLDRCVVAESSVSVMPAEIVVVPEQFAGLEAIVLKPGKHSIPTQRCGAV